MSHRGAQGQGEQLKIQFSFYLIDWLVDQAEQMQLEIPLSKAEEDRLLERWGQREKNTT